jgi:glycosyltransferase involved in cell wall biosynthesis
MPLVIPTNRRDSRCVERLNARVLRRLLLDRILPWTGPGSGCVALIDNPFWVNALRKGDVERMYYDCIDDVRLYAGRAAVDRWRSYERDLLSMCDGAFATAVALEEQIRADAPALPVERVPNGVDSAWFRARVLRESPPADLARLPRPLIGYVGTISDWLDYGSVTALARLLPTHSFVFVGPIDYASRRAELCTAPNIHWLGRKAYEDVPAYIGAFDVCWIPFAQGPIVEHTNPIKLFEYFALGRPVVTTPMPEVLPFTGGGLVYIGQTPQELAGALEAARTGDSAAAQSRRRAVAEEHGWDRLVGRMLAAMQGEAR